MKRTPRQQKTFDEGMTIVTKKLAGYREEQAQELARKKQNSDRFFARCAAGGRTPQPVGRVYRTFSAIRGGGPTLVSYA